MTVGCIVLFFEVARQALDPKTSIWTTHTITILFTMLAAAALTFAALNTKAEGALRQSEAVQRLASIVECSQDAIIGKTTEGVVTSWNRAAEKMYGYTGTEAIGRDLCFLVPSERQGEVQAIMERIRTGQPVECLETQRVTKAGCVLDVSVSISPIKDGSGRIIGASTIARDITLRKRSDEQLKLQSAALEAAAHAVVITDHEGKIVWLNQAFTALTGYSKEEVLGKNPRLLKSGEHSETYYAKLWSTISLGKVWQGELVNKRKRWNNLHRRDDDHACDPRPGQCDLYTLRRHQARRYQAEAVGGDAAEQREQVPRVVRRVGGCELADGRKEAFWIAIRPRCRCSDTQPGPR